MNLLPREAADAMLAGFEAGAQQYADDPVGWVREVCNEQPWSKQRDVMESVRDHRYTAVQACHDVGKSFIASRLIAWWIDSHPPGEAFVVWTAPRWAQVNAIIGRELRALHKRIDVGARITGACDYYIDGDVLVGYGRKPADHDEHGFQGIHDRYVLVVLDEACGIPKALWTAVDSLATNEHARVLAIGNPDDPATEFREVCKPGSGWNRIEISAFDSPNLTGEEVPDKVRELLVSETWIDERRKRWGEGSMLYASKVLGKFPSVSKDTLITPAMVQAAHDTDLPGTAFGTYAFDIARFGSDETVGYRNRGGVIRHVYTATKQDTMQTVAEIGTIIDRHKGGVPAWIDAVGLGAGVFDRLREQRYPVHAFNAGNRAMRPDRFANRRAEVYWTLREMMLEGLVDLDPDDDELASQLQSIKYRIRSDKRIQIETKEEMRKRGLPSPDRADAAVMSIIAPPSFRMTASTGDRGKVRGVTDDLLNREL